MAAAGLEVGEAAAPIARRLPAVKVVAAARVTKPGAARQTQAAPTHAAHTVAVVKARVRSVCAEIMAGGTTSANAAAAAALERVAGELPSASSGMHE